MFLEPGGFITPHNDYEHDKLGPLNISLNNPENCYFKMITDNARADLVVKTAIR